MRIGSTLILIILLSLGTQAWAKEINLKWKHIPGAVDYQLEIKPTSQDSPSQILNVKKLKWTGDLNPGVYQHRVRAIDRVGRPGEWTDWTRLVVMPPVPELEFPAQNAVGTIKGAPPKTLIRWKAIPGVSRYTIEYTHKNSKGSEDSGEIHATTHEAEIPLNKDFPDGTLKWRVRAEVTENGKKYWETQFSKESLFKLPRRSLASIDPYSKSVAAKKRQDPYALLPSTGHISFAGMGAPYTYQLESPVNRVRGSTSSLSTTAQLAAEYWFATQWGVHGTLENTIYNINAQNYSATTFELSALYRKHLGSGFVFSPQLGLERRDYFIALPTASSKATATGAHIGLQFSKALSASWNTLLQLNYFKPLMISSSSGGSLTGDASNRNMQVVLQTDFSISRRVSFGLGVRVDNRSISYGNPSAPEKIYADGMSFYGILLYRLGK